MNSTEHGPHLKTEFLTHEPCSDEMRWDELR